MRAVSLGDSPDEAARTLAEVREADVFVIGTTLFMYGLGWLPPEGVGTPLMLDTNLTLEDEDAVKVLRRLGEGSPPLSYISVAGDFGIAAHIAAGWQRLTSPNRPALVASVLPDVAEAHGFDLEEWALQMRALGYQHLKVPAQLVTRVRNLDRRMDIWIDEQWQPAGAPNTAADVVIMAADSLQP